MLNRVLRAALMSCALGGAALAVPFAAQAQTPAPAAPAAAPAAAPVVAPAADPVVARVNGQELRASEVTRVIAQLPQQIHQMPMEMLYPTILEQMVNQKLLTEAGYKAGLEKTDEVREEIKRAEDRAVQRAYLQAAIQTRITPAMLDVRYKDLLKENPPQDEVKAAHILVDGEDEAKAIIAEIGKGGDFSKLAKDKSKDKAAAEQGGDLGYFTKDAMVEPFADAAFAMKVGEVSKTPVKTQFGWHIIKVEDRRVSKPPSFDEVKAQLEKEMGKEVINALIDDMRKGAKIETFNLDGSPMKAEPAAAPKAEPAPAPAPAAKK